MKENRKFLSKTISFSAVFANCVFVKIELKNSKLPHIFHENAKLVIFTLFDNLVMVMKISIIDGVFIKKVAVSKQGWIFSVTSLGGISPKLATLNIHIVLRQ